MEDSKTPTPRRARTLTSKPVTSRTPRQINSEIDYESPSAIKVNKFDRQRFTQFQDNVQAFKIDHPTRRAIMLVLIVVVIGLALLFVVQTVIKNNASTANSTNTSTSTDNSNKISVANTVKTDSIITPANADFGLASLAVGSSTNLNNLLATAGIDYTPYTNTSRLTIEFSGVVNGLPAVLVKHTSTGNQAVVTVQGLNLPTTLVGSKTDLVGNITKLSAQNNGANADITLDLIADAKYAISVQGTRIFLDLKSPAQINTVAANPTPAPTPAVVPTPAASEAVVDPSKPTTKTIDNVYSKLKQFVVNPAVTTNTLVSETYFYQDFGDSFSFSWAMSGLGNFPNAQASYITDAGKTYIEVKISNLSYDLLHNLGRDKAKIEIPLTATNLVNVFTKGFKDGVATYWVEVKAKTDFKLFSTFTEGTYQLLTLQIKDI